MASTDKSTEFIPGHLQKARKAAWTAVRSVETSSSSQSNPNVLSRIRLRSSRGDTPLGRVGSTKRMDGISVRVKGTLHIASCIAFKE